ncbi:MAG: glycosyltransferase [Alphaproteobacteria bacterium]|nr:glycosyltransferase [Alphaproteobacteria bacterium]
MDKKNILVIAQADLINTVGGAMTIFNHLCNFLCKNNYNVKAVCFNSENITDRPKALDKNVEYVNLYLINQESYSAAINAYLEKNKADLLIFFFPIFYVEAELSKKFNKIPRILMLHSRPDWYFQDKTILDKMKSAWTKNSVAQILFPSYYRLVPDFMKKVTCIANYVTKSADTVTDVQCRKKIVYLSKIDRYKGLQFLLKSMQIVAKQHPDWILDIYGQSVPKDYAGKLQKLAKDLKISGQVHFKGITANSCKTLLEYDIGVFPSFFEGFSIGLSEMLSVGLPTVGLQGASGVNELIIDGYNGYLTADNPVAYAAKIMELIENQEQRKIMSRNAVASMDRFTEENFNNQWLNLINDVLHDKYKNPQISTCIEKYPLFSLEKINKSHKWLDFFHKKTIRLFDFIPVFSKTTFGGRKTYEIFKIPVWKTRHMSDRVKYYFLNILLLEIIKK